MISGKKIAVILPAYNAEKTLARTYAEIPKHGVDDIILVDDASTDKTVEVARTLDIRVVVHDRNRGYGANQKTAYAEALKRGADVVVMLHPDYQYLPELVVPMASLIASGKYDAVSASRFMEGDALKGGMPLLSYFANRFWTALQCFFTGHRLSEYHSGYRAFSREVLTSLPLLENSDDFLFDNQMLTQLFYFGYRVGEVPTACFYHRDASSIGIKRAVAFGIGSIRNILQYRLAEKGWRHYPMFSREGRKIEAVFPGASR